MLRVDWIQFVKGDRLAFRRMYETYVDDLFAFGMSIHPDKEIVLDCIHDIFVNIYGNPKIAHDVNSKFYLFSALRRSILKALKQRGFRTDIDDHILDDKQGALLTKSIEEEIITAETLLQIKHLVLESLEKLPKRQREIIHLRYYMDFSYEEISEIMDVNVGTCRTLSYRAMRLLKQYLPSLGQLGIYFFLLK